MLKKIIVIMSAVFSMIFLAGVTSYGEETGTFTWRDVPVTRFPYFTILHSHDVGIKINGKDIINGESVPGAVYKDGRLWLDDLDIDGNIYINDEYPFHITLDGDSSIRNLIFNGTELYIEGRGSLTAESIQSVDTAYSDVSNTSITLTIRENARVAGKNDPENDTELNKLLNVNNISIKNNGYLKCADLAGEHLSLYDNAYVSAEHCTVDEIILADDSIMKVRSNYEKYPKLDITEDLKSSIYNISKMEIRDNARLSAECYTTDYGILCLGTGTRSQITVSENGILEASGNSGVGIAAYQNYYSMFDMHDNSQVIINGFNNGLITRRLEISGGTLKINSDGTALQINPRALNYAYFGTGIYLYGDVISQSCDWILGKSLSLFYSSTFAEEDYNTLRSRQTNNKLKDFSITVKEKNNEY